MAIVKITDFSSGTTPVSGDWSALVNHFNAYTRQISGFQYPVEHVSGDNLLLKKGSYIQHGGSLYQVQTEDYTVSGSLSWVIGTYNYIKIKASGETLTATLTQDISSYSWSNIYSYLIASDESQILAFCASSPEGNTINIYRLEKKEIQYKSNQNTQTDDDVEFNDIEANKTTSLFQFPDISTGSNIVRYNTEVNSINSIAGKTISSFRCPCSGSLSVLVDLKTNNSSNAAIFEITGGNSTLTLTTSSTEYSTKTGTISFDFNDILTIRLTKSTSETAVVSCENIYLKGSRIPYAIENVAWNA